LPLCTINSVKNPITIGFHYLPLRFSCDLVNRIVNI